MDHMDPMQDHAGPRKSPQKSSPGFTQLHHSIVLLQKVTKSNPPCKGIVPAAVFGVRMVSRRLTGRVR